MSNHLHLHLGAHKTASTHFQYMLQMIGRHSPPGVLIPAGATIRKEITHANRFLIPDHQSDLRALLSQILSEESRSIVISEENLIGEAKDFFDCDNLYKNSRVRLEAFAGLLPKSQNMTIWFFIRSLDSFLPSIYCEYLRHWRYRSFSSVLNGNHLQSWVPVIDTIQSIFPNAQINIVDYHQYHKVFPRILSEMTGVSEESLPRPLKVIRPRLSKLSVRAASILPNHLPFSLRHKTVDMVSHLSRLAGYSKPFSPYSAQKIKRLRDRFERDIETVRNTQTLSLLE